MHRRGGGKFRGGNRQIQQGGRFSDEHDNRASGGGNFNKTNRRVSFKTSGRHSRSIDDMKIRAYLEHDDDMGNEFQQGSSDGGMKRPKGRFIRKGSPIPRGIGGGGRLMNHPSGWYQVTIIHGGKYNKDELLRLIMNAVSPKTFVAHYYKIEQSTNFAQFFVEDFEVAEAILRQDKKIDLHDGFKMIIKVRGSVPQVRIDESLKERMKMAMVKRYNAQTKAMDLTKFHSDPDLVDIFCALARPPIMIAAIDIIGENIPDLEALNLNDNKIGMIDHLKSMATKLPKLKILYLGNNKIFTLSSLDVFKPLPIEELYIEGNPCKKRYKDNATLVRDIQKKFPRLLKLDGAPIGPSIGFDVADDEKTNLPPWKQAFFCNPSGHELAAKFLEQYFAIYDSDNRQSLLEAYHDNAMFSLTATANQHYTREEILSSYWKVGRNLKHPKTDLRVIGLKRGKLSIVALLNDLPKSKHDLNSFAVDLTFFTPQMIVLTVTGLFKERSSDPKAEYARIFQRTLVIVPNNGGFCIKNELLHINNASVVQAKRAFSVPIIPATPSTSPAASTSNMQTPVASISAPDDSTKMRMIQAMSQQSNMNIEWSKKCLEETNWDYNRAGFVFAELFKQNKIPPEAFAK